MEEKLKELWNDIKCFCGIVFSIVIILYIAIPIIKDLIYEVIPVIENIKKKPYACEDVNKDTIQEWIQKYIKEIHKDSFKFENNKYSVSVSDIHDYIEYNSIPTIDGNMLYDDYKDNIVCKATATYILSDTDGNTKTNDIDMRYQMYPNSGYRSQENNDSVTWWTTMSGYDITKLYNALHTHLKEFIKEFKKEDNKNNDGIDENLDLPYESNSTDSEIDVSETILNPQWFKNTSVEELKKVITHIKDINISNEKGITPLMYAVSYSNIEIVKYLIDNEADVNSQNNIGNTVLMFACSYSSDPKIIDLLIDNGADVNIKNSKDKTALDYIKNNAKLNQTNAIMRLELLTH